MAASAANAQEHQDLLEEIVVTATKRTTSLQDTPLAISAFSMSKLEELDVRNTDDLAAIVPGLDIGVSVGNTQMSLRGISNNSFFLAGDPTVAFHVDGIYRGRQTGGMALYYDLERVEVLKGPQGTLYGRNATAGTINVITRRPQKEFGGYVDLLGGNKSRFGARAAINLPLSDSFTVRLAGITEERDGYYDNGPLVTDGSDVDESGMRLHALYEPSDSTSVLLTVDHNSRGGVGDGTNLIVNDDGVLEDFLDGVYGDPFAIGLNTQGDRDDEFTTIRLEYEQELGFGSLTYIGAYYESEVDIFVDFDRNDVRPQTLFVGVESEQLSHELQLKSSGDGPLQWIAGLYLFDEDAARLLDIDIIPVVFIDTSQPDFNAESTAIFGQLTYGFSETLSLTAGLRYTEDEKSESGTVQQRQTPGGTFVGFGDQTASWDSTDWMLRLESRKWDDHLLYATVATGYKSGGFNDPLLNLADPVFQPEEILSVQLGHKSQFADGKLQLNSEVFWYDYTDMQVNQIVNTHNIVQNASSSEILGIDA